MTKRQLCDNSDLAFFYHNKKYEYELMSDYSFVFLVETQPDSKIFSVKMHSSTD